jgi:selenocysteine-specific elongation factor
LYGAKELAPGQSSFVQHRLQDEALLLAGDRFIVRQFSPVTTIGGGVILDPLARRPTVRDTARPAFLETLQRGDKLKTLAAMVERAAFGLTFEEILARTGWLPGEIAAAANSLAGAGFAKAISVDPLILFAGSAFDEIQRKIAARIEKFHKENPLLPGISREDLRSSLGRRVRPEAFRAALDDLLSQKRLEAQGEVIKQAGSTINLDPEEARAKEQIEKAFAAAGLAVPAVKEVLSKLPVESKRAEKILQILLRDKILVRVTTELIFHRDALAQLRDRLSVFKKTKTERISVPVFKELTGVTRKYAIPLLEYLDRERVTRRAGDERVIL